MTNVALGHLGRHLSLLLLHSHFLVNNFLHHLMCCKVKERSKLDRRNLLQYGLDSLLRLSALHVNLAIGMQSKVLLQLLLGGHLHLAHHTLVAVQLQGVPLVRPLRPCPCHSATHSYPTSGKGTLYQLAI